MNLATDISPDADPADEAQSISPARAKAHRADSADRQAHLVFKKLLDLRYGKKPVSRAAWLQTAEEYAAARVAAATALAERWA